MSKSNTLPEHRRVLRRQPGWIRYTVPGLNDVKAYFNGTQEQLEEHIADIIKRRNKEWSLRSSASATVNHKKDQLRNKAHASS